jgi:hypothetical protein
MPPAVSEAPLQPTLHREFGIVDEESLHLLVANNPGVDDKRKIWYCSLDDTTLSTSIFSSSCDGDFSDEDIPAASATAATTTTVTATYATPLCYTKVWTAYYNKLQQYPLIVKSITAFVLMLLADLMAQGVENLRGISHHLNHDGNDDDVFILLPVNWLRTLRFGIFGFLGAPWTHYYYHWLDEVLPPTHNPWTGTTFGP